jgi:hypothetical protein
MIFPPPTPPRADRLRSDKTERRVIGVDFSSAPTPRKPITVAVGVLRCGPQPLYQLDGLRLLPSLDAFEAFLGEPGPWVGGFDLPFGQPRSVVEHVGWPTDWPACVRHFCSQPRQTLRETFRRWCGSRPVGDKFAWRKTDRPAGSSPAMRWTNPPVAWMMHAGIGRMLEAGLVFPAHRHPPLRSAARRGSSAKVAFEAYPGFTARQATRKSYKSDTKAAQTLDRRRQRVVILTALMAGTTALAPRLIASERQRRRLLADGSGDLLDAVICSLQAGHALLQPRYGLPRQFDPLEGWIASVPPLPPR